MATLCYIDLTETTVNDIDLPVSQTLFNNDSYWEYWTTEFKEIIRTERYYSRWNNTLGFYYEDSIFCRDKTLTTTNFSLVNSNNEVLLEIPIEQIDGYYARGSIFFAHDNTEDLIITKISYNREFNYNYDYKYVMTVYSYDRNSTSVKVIARTESRMTVDNDIERGENLNINVNNASKDESVTVSDMSGRVVERKSAAQDRLSFSTANMPKGVYNVTLHGKDVQENQKVIIK